MKSKLLSDLGEQKQAVVIVTGVLALAHILSSGINNINPKAFLNVCEKLAKEYVDRVVIAEKDPEDD